MPVSFTLPELPTITPPALPKSNLSAGLQAIKDKKNAIKDKAANLASAGKDALGDVSSGLTDIKTTALSSIPELPPLPDFATEVQNLIDVPTVPNLDSLSSKFGADAAQSALSSIKSGTSINPKSLIPPGKVAPFPSIEIEIPEKVKALVPTIEGIKEKLNIERLK
jgi:hypothetical protein